MTASPIPGFVDGEPVGGWEFDRTPRRDAAGWWLPPTAPDGRWGAQHEPPQQQVSPQSRLSQQAPSQTPQAPRASQTPPSLQSPRTEQSPPTEQSPRISQFSQSPRTEQSSQSPQQKWQTPRPITRDHEQQETPEAPLHSVEPTDVASPLSDTVVPLRRASDLLGDKPSPSRSREPLPWSTASSRDVAGPEDSRSHAERSTRPATKSRPRLRAVESHDLPAGAVESAGVPAAPTDDELRELGERTLLKKLRSKGLSIAESRTLLRGLGLGTDLIDELVDQIVSLGYLDDAVLAEQLVYQAVSKKSQGRRAISMALSARGIPRDVVEAALEELEDDDDDRALDFARSKARSMASLDRDVALRRLLGQLARRGFAGSSAMSAAKTALDEVSGVRFR